MNRRIIATLLCLLMAGSVAGCSSETESSAAQEQGGGTGYDAAAKSIITEEDLYFLRPGKTRSEVELKLGSAQEYTIADGSTYTYLLKDGQRLVLTYGTLDTLDAAVFTDKNGKKQDLFVYLSDLGVLTGYAGAGSSSGGSGQNKPSKEESEKEPPKDPETQQQSQQEQAEQGRYFASRTYNYDLADEILKVGVERETVIAAMGKPNSFSSIDFEKDTYIIDVYNMADGSTLYLDYGYTRTTLRAVRKIKGSNRSTYLGTWEIEERSPEFYRATVNVDGIKLRKGSKPSEIYSLSRLGEPDWYEGTQTQYSDAYQLTGGRILYLEFGNNHASLSGAYILTKEGKREMLALS